MNKPASPQDLAAKCVKEMYDKDFFSQWLGIDVLETKPGACKLRMKVRDEMLNGFGVAHGGIVYSFADSALAFASNSHGRVSLAVKNSVSYPEKILSGDELTAEATEVSLGDKLAHYDISVKNQNGALVAIFGGMVYRTKKEFFKD